MVKDTNISLKMILTYSHKLNVKSCYNVFDKKNKKKSTVITLKQFPAEMPLVYSRIIEEVGGEWKGDMLLDVSKAMISEKEIVVISNEQIKRIHSGMSFISEKLFVDSPLYLQETEELLLFVQRFPNFKVHWKQIRGHVRRKEYVEGGRLLEITVDAMIYEICKLIESGCVRKGKEMDFMESYLDTLDLYN